MPKVKIRLATGVTVPSRRRAGLQIFSGQPQEFDVNDEQYLALLDDDKLQVTEINDEQSNTAKPKTKAEKLAAATEEGLTLEVTDANTVAEIDAAIQTAREAKEAETQTPPADPPADPGAPQKTQTESPAGTPVGTPPVDPAANVQSAQAAGQDVQNNTATSNPTGDPAANQTASNDGSEQTGGSNETPAIPETAAKIKKQSRDVVVAQAKSLGIELDYEDETKVTKAVIADAIVEKQKEA